MPPLHFANLNRFVGVGVVKDAGTVSPQSVVASLNWKPCKIAWLFYFRSAGVGDLDCKVNANAA